MSMGGKAETKPSPVEQNVARELKQNLFPAADTFFHNMDASTMYRGPRYAGPSGLTEQNRRLMSKYALPKLSRQAFNFEAQQQQHANVGDLSSLEDTFLDAYGAEMDRQRGNTDELISLLGTRAGEEFRRNILPAISDQAMAAGQYGGGAQQDIAEGVAAADFGSDLSLQISQLLREDAMRGDAMRESALNRAFGERTGALDRSLNALTLTPQVQNATMMPYNIRGNMGANIGMENQYRLDDRIWQYDAPRITSLQHLQDYQGLLGFSDARGYTPQSTPGSANPIAGAAGGGLMGYSLAQGTALGGPYGAAIGAGIGLLGSL